jgi:hypothetical protein
MMAANGATRLFVKKLSPNDNSKNQIYLGGDFEALNIIPYNEVYVDGGRDGSKRDRFKADIFLGWMSGGNANVYPAPNSQLILYPKYPEVRLSGFLKGCENPPSELLTSRDEGRLMFLGIRNDGKIIGHVTGPANPVRKQLESQHNLEPAGVFFKLALSKAKQTDTRDQLIKKLREIHQMGWVDSARIYADGTVKPYNAQNAGGYTLEALLGIKPNGHSDPDYLGWEIKQHGVTAFNKPHSGSPITLMTPEPTGGIYKDKGFDFFMRKFGYPAKSGTADRLNFSGAHKYGVPPKSTGLILQLSGYDLESGKIIDPSGGIVLVNTAGEEAAMWHYADMMKHWNRKHAQAAYITSLKRKAPNWQYSYGNHVELGTGTDFLKFLGAIGRGIVYYDPGCNLKNILSSKPLPKRRSQFRIKAKNIKAIYNYIEVINVRKD